ncbi:predicted protein, partial [Nematostella vectensis]
IYAFIALAALLGNILVLWIVYKNHALRSIPNYFVISLACSDIAMVTLATPWSIAVLASGKWPFDFISCQFQGFIVIWAAIASLHNLTIMAINRFLRIVKPAHYRKFFSPNKTRFYVLFAYMYSTISPLPYLIGGNVYVFQPGKFFCYQTATVQYTIPLMGIFICIPTFIIVGCYTRVFLVLRAHAKNMNTHRSVSVHSSLRITVEDIKVTRTLFATVATFLLCWSPVVIIEFVDVALGASLLPRRLYVSFTFCGLCSSAVNPIIYGAMNKKFRREYKKVF